MMKPQVDKPTGSTPYGRCMAAAAILNREAYLQAKATYTPAQQRQIERGGLPGEPRGRVPRYQPCEKAQVYQQYAGIMAGGDKVTMTVVQQEVQLTFCNCHDILTTDDLLAMEFAGGG